MLSEAKHLGTRPLRCQRTKIDPPPTALRRPEGPRPGEGVLHRVQDDKISLSAEKIRNG
jgi:hypothetical protein